MRKITFIAALFVAFSTVFTACEVEPIDPVLNDYVPEEGTGDTDGDGNTDGSTGTTEGDYWPMAINNVWDYVYTGDLEEDPEPMKIIATEVINGKTYYKMNHYFQDSGTADLTGTAEVYIRKEGGTYYQRVSVVVPSEEGVPAITISPYELTVLKDNLEVGQGWTESVMQTTTYDIAGFPPITMTIDITGTILEKGITVTVGGETYTDVIKEKVVQAVMGTTTTSYIYFAKNVGPIKSEASADGINYLMTLTSYTIN
jgi:hypothetical protein